jgi:predicted DNA-binding protein
MARRSEKQVADDQVSPTEGTAGISLRIPAAQGHALDVLGEVMGRSKSDVIRMAIEEFIERRTSPEAVEKLAEEMRDRVRREVEEAARRLHRP